MKSKRVFKAFATGLILLIVFTTGCYYDHIIPVEPEGEVSYALDIQPYFDASCTRCHNGSGIPLDLTSPGSYNALLSGNYVNTADHASSLLYTKIAPGGSMEQYSTSTETAMTLKWIEQGAKNN